MDRFTELPVSEEEFQDQFAGFLQEEFPTCLVWTGGRPPNLDNSQRTRSIQNVDIWVFRHNGILCALELKYLTRPNNVGGNLTQSGIPQRQYDFLLDIHRLEEIVQRQRFAATGYAILLTNDRGSWDSSSHRRTVSYPIEEENEMLQPGPHDGLTNQRNRSRRDPITLDRSYTLNWRDFSVELPMQQFRYLTIQVNPKV